LFFWNELRGASGVNLATASSNNGDLIRVTTPHAISAGSLVQIDNEILRVLEVLSSGEELRVIRGTLDSVPTAHNDGSAVFQLSEQTSTIAFPRDFFGSPASGSWKYPVFLPNTRIAGAEVQVSNGLGGSPVSSACVTQTIDGGLRTLSGGQISFTIGGFLAIQDGAVPDFVAERDRSIGSVHAVVQQAPSGTSSPGILLRLRQGTDPFCTLTIPNGSTSSNTVNGFGLPVLQEGSKLSLDVLSVGATTPGSDLTVTVQL
jgi:predicted RecA/RadA family phage recombinase